MPVPSPLPPSPPALVVSCDVACGAAASVGSRAVADGRPPVVAAQGAVPLAPASPPGDSRPPSGEREQEWLTGGGYAWSIDVLQSEAGRRYIPVTLSWGRDLTRDVGPGVLRGRLMWAVEIMPLYWQHRPTNTAGAAISPLVWRWRFTPRRRLAPFAELAFGGLFSADPVPERTESANFISHGGVGIRWQPARRASWVTAYRFQHISNGNQLSSNPGVNAHVAWIGVSLIR